MRALIAAVLIAIAAALPPVWFNWRKVDEQQHLAVALTGGDPRRAVAAMTAYGCAGCHFIPGLAGARGQVGPPLTGVAGQIYIAGVLTNTPENLVRWIVDPIGVDPQTAMPVTGISEDAARDIAAYLYSR
jgi:cytochrome c1